jgi:hypothetical protein
VREIKAEHTHTHTHTHTYKYRKHHDAHTHRLRGGKSRVAVLSSQVLPSALSDNFANRSPSAHPSVFYPKVR